MTNLRQAIASSFLQLSTLFVLLALLQGLELLPGFLKLLPLSFALPLLGVAILGDRSDTPRPSFSLAPVLLMVAFGLALALRLGLSLEHEVLLGYDPGIYRYVLDTYARGLPDIAEADLLPWLKANYPQGLPVLGTLLHVVAGLSPDALMRYLFPVATAAVVFPLYLLGKELFGSRAAVIGALLYAVSYTQLSMFTLMYLKNGIAVFLLSLALYALHRRSYFLFGLLVGGIGMYHRPTLVVAAVLVVAYLLATRRRDILVGALVALAVAAPIFLLRWGPNWEVLRGALDATLGNLGQEGTTGGGTFFGLERYRWVSLAYQPFAMLGALALVWQRRWASPALLLLFATVVLVTLQAFFFRRHLVPLDLAMLLLAGLGIEVVFLRGRRWGAVAGGLVVAAIVGAVAVPTIGLYRDVAPMLTEGQMEAVQWLSSETPADAAVVVTSHDAPWVLGWSERRTIAPGLFHWSLHNREEWQRFLGTEEPQEAREFLELYTGPLFVYYSDQPANFLADGKFQTPWFRLVYNDGGARIYEYTP